MVSKPTSNWVCSVLVRYNLILNKLKPFVLQFHIELESEKYALHFFPPATTETNFVGCIALIPVVKHGVQKIKKSAF